VHPLDFPLWLRALHFCNLLFVTLLIRSGLEILSAHPKLYWNDDCLPGSAWLKFGGAVPNTRRLSHTPQFGNAVIATGAAPNRKTAIGTIAFFLLSMLYVLLLAFVIPRGEAQSQTLWTSTDEEISLPSWLALPGHKNLGMGRHWHFLCDGGWLLTGLAYYALLFATGEWHRLVPQSWSSLPGAWHSFLVYASFNLVKTPGAYNPLQQLSYFGIVFIIAPITIATGLAMSPSITGRFPWYLKLFGGRQPARSIHFLCMLAFTGFIIMHVLMVILHGLGRELALIVLGQTANPQVNVALLIGCLGLLGVFLIHVVATEASLRHPRFVQNTIGTMIDGARKTLFGHSLSHQAYPATAVSSYFRVNGRPPIDRVYQALASNNFVDYQLEISGLVEKLITLSLSDLKRLPKHSQITKHCCIQGWSAVAEWGGASLKDIVELSNPLNSAKYVALYAFDNKAQTEPHSAAGGFFYGTIHIDLARDPQTILAYEMNGKPLPIAHGAPLRLRVETQLGFMMVKYIKRIEFIADYKSIGQGQGGWREDHQFYSPEAGI